MTYYRIDIPDFENKYNINFNDYFKNEINALQTFIKEGILIISKDKISVTELGNFFLRNICAVFDNLNKGYKHNVETGVKNTPSCQ